MRSSSSIRARPPAPVQPVDAQRLGDDLAHSHAWVERRVGILEDDLHLPPHLAHLAPRETGDVAPVEEDLAGRGLRQLHDRPPERCLAAAGLADDAERLAGAHAEVDAVDRMDLADLALQEAAADREVLDEALDAEDLVTLRAALVDLLDDLAHAIPSPTPAAVVAAPCPCSSSAKWQRVRCSRSSMRRRSGTSVRQSARPCDEEAARMERAPGRHVEHARRLAGDRAEPVVLGGEPRQALHQADRVRVPGVREDREDVAHLDDAAGVHHDHAVAELGDEARGRA